ncbi:MAG TPA: M15 family metallopeptidase [Actinophytocola sp.]|uniref:M15 family metallopeptidase n=1 Tax=Actinophytocola sp. TaxID=1872138 RepID=UPI002DDD6636|nr:M15 family metallopeptidase [Actinophytocola sp.]HEV2778157.1 M15 family metallopeptidase [Actinophytocola sp.]
MTTGLPPAEPLLASEDFPEYQPHVPHWPGASQEQQDFAVRVIREQSSRAARKRPYVADVPSGELATVERGQSLRAAAAADAVAMLAAARADLLASSPRQVEEITVVSGYRSASAQLRIWEANFPKYYRDTEASRSHLPDGPHGEGAVRLLATRISRWLAAPGYSLHNTGVAMDLGAIENGVRLGANSRQVDAWRQSTTFAWLRDNAARFNFHQNTTINEPWHWEHRPPVHRVQTEAENDPVQPGRLEVADVPVLRAHRGSGPDLLIKWNAIPAGRSTVDVVVHFHGYARHDAQLNIVNRKEPNSGLDFVDPEHPDVPGRTEPTVALLPRGHYFGGRTGTAFSFPQLGTPNGLMDLIFFALDSAAQSLSRPSLTMNRLILTAHSGGGAGLLGALRHVFAHEVHIFDALYQDPATLRAWSLRRLQRERSDPAQHGALRVFYLPGSPTEGHSLTVRHVVRRALAEIGADTTVSSRYRVERTRLAHEAIPRAYGWRLLADPGADVSRTR